MSGFFGKELTNSKGINVNGIIAFFHRVVNLKNYFGPDYIVIANDVGRARTFRRKLYAPYKATRAPAPEGILEQLRYGLQLCYHLGYPIINHEDYEADDILGMVSKFGNDNNMDVVLVTSDRDYYQLVSEQVVVFNPRKSEIIDTRWIVDTYRLQPYQLIELKALAGDKSDNIPGATGIGNTTALRLMQRFGSIAAIYDNIDSLTGRLQRSLDSSRELIELSRILGTIVTDYSLIDLTIDRLERQPYRNPQLAMLTLRDLEINVLTDIFTYDLIPLGVETAD